MNTTLRPLMLNRISNALSKHKLMKMAASTLVLGSGLLSSEIGNASVTAYISAREKNSLGIQGEMTKSESFISREDCMDDIEFTITISVSSENTEGRELYIFAGDNCDSSDDTDDCDDDVIKLDADETSQKLPVSFIINTDDCGGDDAPSLWVGLLESRTEKEDNATWASPIDFNFSGALPAAPVEFSVSQGENNLVANWKIDDEDNDLSGYLIVYAKAVQSDAADEVATEEEADGGIDAGVDEWDTDTGSCEGPLTEGSSLTSSMSWVKIASGSSKSGRVKKLKNGVPYQTAIVAIDEYGNPSPLSEVVCKEPANTLNFYEVYRAAGGKGGGDYCFIATAAFGNLDHPVVRILRRFRDEVILRLPLGGQFVSWYYSIGPKLVEEIHSETAYEFIRAGLLVFAGAASMIMEIADEEPVEGDTGK